MWKEIPGYEGLYSVDENGEVFSHYKNKKLIKTLSPQGYFRIGLQKNTLPKIHFAHRLVALTFILNPENKPCVNHKNGIKTDNRVENLEWRTQSENLKHSYSVLGNKGSMTGKFGEKNHKSKKIIQRSISGEFIQMFNGMREAARMLNFPNSTNIRKCCKGERKLAYGFMWEYVNLAIAD